MMCDRSCSGYWRKGRYLPFDLWRVRLRLSDGLAALIPGPSPASVITHKSTYGQRYLPSPPDPLSRTAGEGGECWPLWVLCSQGWSRNGMRTIACCCRHDCWL